MLSWQVARHAFLGSGVSVCGPEEQTASVIAAGGSTGRACGLTLFQPSGFSRKCSPGAIESCC